MTHADELFVLRALLLNAAHMGLPVRAEAAPDGGVTLMAGGVLLVGEFASVRAAREYVERERSRQQSRRAALCLA